MESDRDRRFALEGFVRYHDDRIWKQTQKLVREEKEAITKMAVTLTAIRITAMLLISWFALMTLRKFYLIYNEYLDYNGLRKKDEELNLDTIF